MSIGFNSKVQRAEGVFDVQTEDHGAGRPFIDTVVVLSGQVLHKRSASYADLLANGPADPAALRTRAERQHLDVLEALRSGSLSLREVALPESAAIQVKLCNPQSWLSNGKVTLEIEVRARAGDQPVSGATVEAGIEGAADATARFAGETDAAGRLRLEFAFPRLADSAAAALVISASAGRARDQLRYNLKPASTAPAR